jgi:type VI secretion system ImpC/EvpB family protein
MLVPDADRGTVPPGTVPGGSVPYAAGHVARVHVAEGEGAATLEAVLQAATPEAAATAWLDRLGSRDPALAGPAWRQWLDRQIAQIDAAVTGQLNAILHHPRFQRLEAAWRGLEYLVSQTADCVERWGDAAFRRGKEALVQVRMLPASWRELARDAEQAIDFDQSALFRMVYEEEFGMPGGTPYGLLVGDYYLQHALGEGHTDDDVATLTAVAGVAAASFAPFISAAHPSLLGLQNMGEIAPHLNLEREQNSLEFLKWRGLRKRDDARFVGLTVPRVLLRTPYRDEAARRDGFCFQEDVEGPDASKYLWGNGAFAFAAVVVRAFAASRWFADIRGAQRQTDERAVAAGRTVVEAGGLVTALAVDSFRTDQPGVAPKFSTEVMIDDETEVKLSALGLVTLSPCPDSDFCAFYSNQALHLPAPYTKPGAEMSAKLGSMLQYTLCVSRVAHYIKVIARDWIGKTSEAEELQSYLENWLAGYVTPDADASPENKAKKPLREAKVQVDQVPGKPGSFKCIVQLMPHFQLDALSASVRLSTELAPIR